MSASSASRSDLATTVGPIARGSVQGHGCRGADRRGAAGARDDDSAVLRGRCRPPAGEGAGYRPAHVRNALASHTGRGTQDEARAALHGIRIPQACRLRSGSRGIVRIGRLMPTKPSATVAMDRCRNRTCVGQDADPLGVEQRHGGLCGFLKQTNDALALKRLDDYLKSLIYLENSG